MDDPATPDFDEAGTYELPDLGAGLYAVRLDAQGAETWLQTSPLGNEFTHTDYPDSHDINHTLDTPQAVASADFNGDGYPDLAVAHGNYVAVLVNYDSGNVSVLRNQGGGTFAPAENYEAGSGPYSITAADLDGDAYEVIAFDHVMAYGTAGGRNTKEETPPLEFLLQLEKTWET